MNNSTLSVVSSQVSVHTDKDAETDFTQAKMQKHQQWSTCLLFSFQFSMSTHTVPEVLRRPKIGYSGASDEAFM